VILRFLWPATVVIVTPPSLRTSLFSFRSLAERTRLRVSSSSYNVAFTFLRQFFVRLMSTTIWTGNKGSKFSPRENFRHRFTWNPPEEVRSKAEGILEILCPFKHGVEYHRFQDTRNCPKNQPYGSDFRDFRNCSKIVRNRFSGRDMMRNGDVWFFHAPRRIYTKYP
jgi:RNA recognition motif-containing protein